MGIAQYDPASLGRPAWNAGRKVGVKKPLKQRQIGPTHLRGESSWKKFNHLTRRRPSSLEPKRRRGAYARA